MHDFLEEQSNPELMRHAFDDMHPIGRVGTIDEVANVYGVTVPPKAKDLTLAQYLDREFHTRCVVGDRVVLGSLELIVREMVDEQVFKVGVRVVRPKG